MRQVHLDYLTFAFGAWKPTPYISVIGQAQMLIATIALTTETTMKVIVSALIALSLLTGVAASASAFDAKTFYEQQDRAAS
ncbi:MAG: hypothetical protein WAO08_23095 [Hyphomicrobiaceae bacterium]